MTVSADPTHAGSAWRFNMPWLSALAGLDFFIREQVVDINSADYGRFPFVYRCDTGRATALTTNWTTGVLIQAMLIASRFSGNDHHLQAARRAVRYLYSLQPLGDPQSPMHGAFHEESPDDAWMHPRDGLTAAWALLQFGRLVGDAEATHRAELFGEWFLRHAMREGYPAWTARFDGKPWEPDWLGSFHSGSAVFLVRLARHTGDTRYERAARLILDTYNRHLLMPDGRIRVVVHRNSLQAVDGVLDSPWIQPKWEQMHVYNDDFGAMANLTMYHHTGEKYYLDAADRFLKYMATCQQPDGGFGPTGQSIPSAAGMILIEWWLGRYCGLSPCTDEQFAKVIEYLESIQVRQPGPASGAFLGFDADYKVDGKTANARTGGYAILSLLMIAGAIDPAEVMEGGV